MNSGMVHCHWYRLTQSPDFYGILGSRILGRFVKSRKISVLVLAIISENMMKEGSEEDGEDGKEKRRKGKK